MKKYLNDMSSKKSWPQRIKQRLTRVILFFFKNFIDNYRKGPGLFWKWFLLTIVIGTIGFWVLIIQYKRLGFEDAWLKAVLSGNISTFCIVVLAEILGYYEIQKRKDIKVSEAFPTFITLLLIINIVIYSMIIQSNTRSDFVMVATLSFITIIVVILSFGYRDIETIDTAGKMAQEENERVASSNISTAVKSNPIPPKRK